MTYIGFMWVSCHFQAIFHLESWCLQAFWPVSKACGTRFLRQQQDPNVSMGRYTFGRLHLLLRGSPRFEADAVAPHASLAPLIHKHFKIQARNGALKWIQRALKRLETVVVLDLAPIFAISRGTGHGGPSDLPLRGSVGDCGPLRGAAAMASRDRQWQRPLCLHPFEQRALEPGAARALARQPRAPGAKTLMKIE